MTPRTFNIIALFSAIAYDVIRILSIILRFMRIIDNMLALFTPQRCLGIALLISFALRANMAQSYLIVGDDMVGYLNSVEGLRGGAEGYSWLYHAVGGLYLLPFVLIGGLFNPFVGPWAAAIIGSLIMAYPMYLILKRIVNEWIAVLGAIAFIWLPPFGDVLAWGFMTMLTMSVGLFALHHLLTFTENGSRKALYFTIGLAAIIPFLNSSALPIILPVILLMVVKGIPALEKEDTHLYGLALLLLGLSVGFAATYEFTGAPITVKSAAWLLYGMTVFGVSGIAGSKIRGNIGFMVICIGLIAGLLAIFTSPNSPNLIIVLARAYLWTLIPLTITGIWLVDRAVSNRKTYALWLGILVAFVLFMIPSWSTSFHTTAADNSTLTPATYDYIQGIDKQIPKGATIAVAPHMLARHVSTMVEGHEVIAIYPEGIETTLNPIALEASNRAKCAAGIYSEPCPQDHGIDYIFIKNSNGEITFRAAK